MWTQFVGRHDFAVARKEKPQPEAGGFHLQDGDAIKYHATNHPDYGRSLVSFCDYLGRERTSIENRLPEHQAPYLTQLWPAQNSSLAARATLQALPVRPDPRLPKR